MAVTFIVSPKVRRFEEHFPPIFLPKPRSGSVKIIYEYRKEKTVGLATPRRPCSPEGRCARARPQHVSAASYGRPEHILPGHLGPVGAPRGGRRHAASIWGSRRPSSTHGRVAPRPTIWRRTDAPRPRIRTRLRRAAGHRPAPHRATTALQHEARSRHNIEPRTREPSRRRRRRVGTRNFPNFFPNL